MARIVVGYDGTPASEPALETALHEAARTSCDLQVVTTWRTAPYVGSVPGYGYDVIPPLDEDSDKVVPGLDFLPAGSAHARGPCDLVSGAQSGHGRSVGTDGCVDEGAP